MTTAREVLDAAMSEAELQASVLALARLRGWKAYHTWSSVHSTAGFPDLFLVRGPRALAIELKREDKWLTVAQREWLDALEAAGIETYWWRPSDLSSGLVEAVLA